MAIDYDSGAGLFDKLGPLVRVINLFEEFEVGTLQTKLTAIYGKLETANEYDDRARQLFYAIDAEEKGSLRSWKQDMLALIQPILTQEMSEAENFFSSDIDELLKYLIFCMNRDSETVDGSTITITGPAAGTPTPTGDFSVVASKYASTVQNADSSSQENGIIWGNPYQIVCVNNTVSGAESFQVRGALPLAGRTDPAWQNAGNAGRLNIISSISNTLLTNGGFESLNGAGTTFANWVIGTGAYTTDIVRDTTPYRGTYNCKFVNNAKITQTLAVDTLKPWTKYLITYKAKKSAAGSDGTLKVGFTGTTGLYSQVTINSGLTTTYAIYHHFFNTGADPGAIRDFIIERTSGTTANVHIDEVTLTSITPIHGLGLAVIAGSIDPALDDLWNVTAVNNAEGVFMHFFGRWYDTLLPGNTGGTETIADTLAT